MHFSQLNQCIPKHLDCRIALSQDVKKTFKDACANEQSLGNCHLGALGLYYSALGKGALERVNLKVIELWTERAEWNGNKKSLL